MQRCTVAPKTLTESRIESIDVSSLLQGADILTGAVATCAVYSGTDASPSAVVGTLIIDSTYNRVYVPLRAGVLGCTYQIVLTVSYSNAVTGAGTRVLCFFLVVIPDAI